MSMGKGVPLMTDAQLRAATVIMASLIHHGHMPITQPAVSVDFVFIEDVPERGQDV